MDAHVDAFSQTATNSCRRPFEAGRTPFDGLRIWSAITHGVGILLAIIGTVFLVYKMADIHSGYKFASFVIFSTTLILLYTASTLYHSVRASVRARIALRKFDHTAVYFLIAGTYTPLCLTILHGTIGFVLLATIWTLAVAGTVMAFSWINAPRKVNATIYIILGWISAISLPFIYQSHGIAPIAWLLAGGVLYTIGGVLYALKWPGRTNPRFGCHEIFHVFIVLGSIAHYLMIYRCLV